MLWIVGAALALFLVVAAWRLRGRTGTTGAGQARAADQGRVAGYRDSGASGDHHGFGPS